MFAVAGVAQGQGAGTVGDWLDGRWNASGDEFECRLERDIPGFGVARFAHEAGRTLAFSVSLLGPAREDRASLSLRTPPWHPRHQHDELLAAVAIKKDSPNLQVGERMADRVLAALRDGWLTAVSPDRDPGRAWVVAGVGMRGALEQFSTCRLALAPISFRQVENTAVHFPHDEYGLTAEALRALDNVVTYLDYDPSIQSIWIDGHTDSTGIEKHNFKLSARRAETVSSYLLNRGVPVSKLVIGSHADDQPIASNGSEKGRALNRRANLRLSKDAPPATSPPENATAPVPSSDTADESKQATANAAGAEPPDENASAKFPAPALDG